MKRLGLILLLLVIVYLSVGAVVYVVDDVRNWCYVEPDSEKLLWYLLVWPIRGISEGGAIFLCPR